MKVVTDSDNLTAIAMAIREKLGVATMYYPSEMAAAIGQIAGGTGKLIQSDRVPTSSDVVDDGTAWIAKGHPEVLSEDKTVKYTLTISEKKRDNNVANYGGFREVRMPFSNGSLIQDMTGFTQISSTRNAPSIASMFDKNTAYVEATLEGSWVYVYSVTVPAGVYLTSYEVMSRNDSSWHDYWGAFSLVETIDEVDYTIVNKSGLVYNDWNHSGYTVFELSPAPCIGPSPTFWVYTNNAWTQVNSFADLEPYLTDF